MQAGSDDQLRGFLVGPFSIYGGGEYPSSGFVCVAPLKSPMFLDLDFLQGQVILDLVHSTLSVGGETTRSVQKELVDTVNYDK
jgi:hypothetical protein